MLNFHELQKSLSCRGISWPFSMFDIVFAQVGVIPTIRNKFVEIVVVVERYLIIAHVKNKESKKRPFWINLPVKLADRKMSVKKEKNCPCLNYNIVSLGKMAGTRQNLETEPFSYWENLPLFWMMLNLLIFRLWIIIFTQGKHLPVQGRQ